MKRFKGHNKLLVLGTAGVDENGELYLSQLGKRRCDRAVEAYYASGFKREKGSMLISGGYGKELFESPPVGREALVMADYIIKQYQLPASAMLLEEESTTTEENFSLSLLQHREFFEEVANYGDRKLGVVSHAEHLDKALSVGAGVLKCYSQQLVDLPAWGPMVVEEPPVQAVAKIIPFPVQEEVAYVSGLGDQ